MLKDQSVINAVLSCNLFEQINEEATNVLKEEGKLITVKRKKDLLDEIGSKDGLVYFYDGVCKWRALDVNGNDRIIKYFGANDVMIIDKVLALFNSDQYFEAVKEVQVVFIPSSTMESMMLASPELRMKYLVTVAKKADEFDSRASRLMQNTVRERLGIAIDELTGKFGLDTSNKLKLPFTKKELCHLLSASKSSVNRLLQELNENNAVYFNKNNLYVNNLSYLRSMAEGRA